MVDWLSAVMAAAIIAVVICALGGPAWEAAAFGYVMFSLYRLGDNLLKRLGR